MNNDQRKWHDRFLEMADLVAGWSKDPVKKVGAVIVDSKRRVIATGYNSFPRGMDDFEELYRDKPFKYPRVVHAELNAILNAVKDVDGATMYISPLPPCSECAKAIIQSGIAKVYFHQIEHIADKWARSFEISIEMFKKAGIEAYRVTDETIN